MASYTTRNRFIKQVFNENTDTWGDPVLNSQAIDMIDESLDGDVSISSTGGTYTLTSSNGATDESRARVLNISGTLTSNLIIRCPAVDKWYIARNLTSGSFTVTLGISGGVHATLPQGRRTIVYLNGTDAVDTEPPINTLGPATGNLSMGSNKITSLADGTNSADAANFGQLLAYFSSSNPGLLGIPLWRAGFR